MRSGVIASQTEETDAMSQTQSRPRRVRCAIQAIAVAALIAATAFAVPAHATLRWDFTYSGVGSNGNNTATGVLTTTDLINGAYYSITGISGFIDGVSIAGIAGVGSGITPFLTDNKLFATGPLLDTGGFIVEAAAPQGFGSVHAPEQIQLDPFVHSIEPPPVFDAALPGDGVFSTGSFAATQIPVAEPTAVGMLGSGLLAVGLLRLRRRRG
jgi:hypothetical protein